MSTSPLRRKLISLLIRSDGYGNPIVLPGSKQVVSAFNDRDPKALAQALATHPGAWKTEMPHKTSVSVAREAHMAASMAVALNWPAGLDVLLAAPGADPDARFEQYDRTALDLAIRMARPPLVRRLLAAGATTGKRDIAASIGAMFNKEYSRTWFDKCWRVLREIDRAGASPWSSLGKPAARVLISLLDCYSHPDGGMGQAMNLLEKFPPPPSQCRAISRYLSKNLQAAGVLWTPSVRLALAGATTAPLFSALDHHRLHPGPLALVRTGAAKWEANSTLAPATAQWIRSTLQAGLACCDPATAAVVLGEFDGHPCLEGPAQALLSNLAMAQATSTVPSVHQARAQPRL